MQGNFDQMTFNMMLNMMNVIHPNMGYNPNNFNNYNSAALMNMMMNWMNSNPLLLQMYNNNMFQNNNMNFNNNNMNFNNNVPNNFAAPQNIDELQCNVTFITQTGKKIMMSCPYNTKLKDFLVKYASRMGISESLIGKDIYFIFNGLKVNEKEEASIGQFVRGTTNPTILVIDTKNILGA